MKDGLAQADVSDRGLLVVVVVMMSIIVTLMRV